jgi:hypothetical protein
MAAPSYSLSEAMIGEQLASSMTSCQLQCLCQPHSQRFAVATSLNGVLSVNRWRVCNHCRRAIWAGCLLHHSRSLALLLLVAAGVSYLSMGVAGLVGESRHTQPVLKHVFCVR